MFTIKIVLFAVILKLIYCEVDVDADVDIATRLKSRYDDLSSVCLDSENRQRPAYECSGLIIRGINFDPNQMKYPWSKKESNIRTNSFAYSYLRADQQFSRFPRGYKAGFFIYPHLKTPPTFEENKLNVFCAFPLDAFTDMRNGSHGCGQNRRDDTGSSIECNLQGIDSLEKWVSHFQNITNSENTDFNHRQCGFDLTTENAAEAFQIVVAAKIYLRENSNRYAYQNNEFRIEAWDEENCKEIPIEAFFYVIDSAGADEKAVSYREEFRKCSGRTLPVVGIRLPNADRDMTIENYD